MSAATDYIQLTHAASEIDGTIDEVYAARGSYGNLSLKIASKQEELSQSQLAAVNSGITAEKLAADEAALAEVVDGGAKNLLQPQSLSTIKSVNTSGTWNDNIYTDGAVSFEYIEQDGSVKVVSSGTNTQSQIVLSNILSLVGKTLILSGCPLGGSYASKYALYAYDSTGSLISKSADEGSGSGVFTVPSNARRIAIVVRAGVSINDTFKPMLCTAADWAVSQKFVPYCPTMAEMAEKLTADEAALAELTTKEQQNENNILIEDITSILTASTGFTVNSNSKLYKQNKHIFGTIIIEKTGGNFSTAQETIANISTYAPLSNYFACPCFCTSLWNVQNIGYGFIARSGIAGSGDITVSDIVTTNNYVKLAVDYITQ